MINIVGFYRKRNTKIYLLIISLFIVFIYFISNMIYSLNNNKIEYDNYFITENIPTNIDKKDILKTERCFFIDNQIISINENLKNNELILGYSLSEKSEFIINNNFKIVDYGDNTFISSDKYKEIAKKEKEYYRIYLKKISDNKKYEKIINSSLYMSVPVDLNDTSKSVLFLQIFLKLVEVIIIVLIVVVTSNIINDNKDYKKILILLGYTKKRLLLMTIVELLSLIFLAIVLSIIVIMMKGLFI